MLQGRQLTGQARQALGDGDSQTALDLYRQALQAYTDALDLSPDNAEALTYRGWLHHNLAVGVGEGPEADELDGYARQDLDQAVAADPSYTDARIFRAIMAADSGDFATAQADLDAADPADIPTFMTSTVDQLRARIAAGLAGSTP